MLSVNYKGFPHPTAPIEGSQKLSSLKSKVKERQAAQQQRERMLSELTAQDATIENEAQLKEKASKNHYSMALVLMLQAIITPGLSQATKENLVKVRKKIICMKIQYMCRFIFCYNYVPNLRGNPPSAIYMYMCMFTLKVVST